MMMNHNELEETDTLSVYPSCVGQLEGSVENVAMDAAGNVEVLPGGAEVFGNETPTRPCCNKKLVVRTHDVSSPDSQRERWLYQLKERQSKQDWLSSKADS